jgi:hypothetical protein
MQVFAHEVRCLPEDSVSLSLSLPPYLPSFLPPSLSLSPSGSASATDKNHQGADKFVNSLSLREDSRGDVDSVGGGDAHGGWDVQVKVGDDVKREKGQRPSPAAARGKRCVYDTL